MPDRNYGFAVGRIRVLETRLIDSGRLERMAGAAGLEEARDLLGETEYAPLVAEGLGPSDLAAAELKRVRDLLLRIAPDSPELTFLLWRWDLLNIKSLLRSKHGAGTPALNTLGMYSPELIQEWFAGKRADLPEIFIEARREAGDVYAETGDPQRLDAAVDRIYYGRGAGFWEERAIPLLASYWKARIDLINLRAMVRSRFLGLDRRRLWDLLLDGGTIPRGEFANVFGESWDEVAAWIGRGDYAVLIRTCDLRDLPALEKASENVLLERIKAAKGIPLGIEPVLGYYLAKEHETRLVNMVLAAKTAGVPESSIKERLRFVYV